MKKISTIVFLLGCIQFSKAQWIQQPAPTTSNLKDVIFVNNKTGYAVGDGGTVIKTSNGGTSWQLVSFPFNYDLTSVYATDSLDVFVCSSAYPDQSAVYESTDGGLKWQRVLSDNTPFYITGTGSKKLFAVSRSVYQSNNLGTTWINRVPVNSTSSYPHISFSGENTGMATGNISGIITYSADFLRTFDGGEHWYKPDQFKFPNANGFSAMHSMSPDSVFMFTNFYNRFSEGDSSQLILLTNFRLRTFRGDSSVVFKNDIVVRSFNDKIRDCRFYPSGKAYAAGDKGVVYISLNGGRQWKTDYIGHTGIKALHMFTEDKGIAVGNKGLILKRTPQVSGVQSVKYAAPLPATF